MANITIIGIRGAGKSNVSRRLSVLTKRPVFATDTMVEYEALGTPIPDLVAQHGWPAFREREFEVLRKIAHMDGIIIDAGGGLVIDLVDGAEVFSERKVSLLRSMGPVFWLRGDVPRLVAKVQAKADRPALAETAQVLALMQARQSFYERAATHIIDIEGLRREDIAYRILDALGLEPAGSP